MNDSRQNPSFFFGSGIHRNCSEVVFRGGEMAGMDVRPLRPFLVPIAIRFTEDGRSLLIDRGVDYQKIKDCGGNAAFIRYFCLVWRIELSALMGKGSVDLLRWAGDRRDR
jgi:hypothetical protein